MSEHQAFVLFAVAVGGVLGLITVGMLVAVVVLIRRNRQEDRR